jgi:hypothetical protein
LYGLTSLHRCSTYFATLNGSLRCHIVTSNAIQERWYSFFLKKKTELHFCVLLSTLLTSLWGEYTRLIA